MGSESNQQSAFSAWKLPDLGEPIRTVVKNVAEDPNYKTGYDCGYEKALSEAEEKFKALQEANHSTLSNEQSSLGEKMKALDLLIQDFKEPYNQLQNVLEHECLALVGAIAEKLYQKAITDDPQQLLKMIMTAKMQLPLASGHVQLKLNPEDSVRIRQCLEVINLDNPFELIDDSKCAPGEFILMTDKAYIDGTLKQRLGRLLPESAIVVSEHDR